MTARPTLRPARAEELSALSELCLRSKGHWGYDAAFLATCRAELTLTVADLTATHLIVAERAGRPVGLAQIEIAGGEADLLKLFVEPDAIGGGVGAALFAWAVEEARRHGARRLTIESDPDARPFYERMGATVIGTAPSASIPGRMLPCLTLAL